MYHPDNIYASVRHISAAASHRPPHSPHSTPSVFAAFPAAPCRTPMLPKCPNRVSVAASFTTPPRGEQFTYAHRYHVLHHNPWALPLGTQRSEPFSRVDSATGGFGFKISSNSLGFTSKVHGHRLYEHVGVKSATHLDLSRQGRVQPGTHDRCTTR